MVNWWRGKSSEITDRLSTIEIKGSRVLTFLNSDIYEKPNILIHDENYSAELNMKEIVAPMGRIGRMLIKNNRIDVVKDIIKTYWLESGNPDPKFLFDVINTDEGDLTLRNKIVFKANKKDITLKDFFDKVKLDDYKDYDELVIGGEGDHAEIQFLSTIKGRIEARKGDFLDAGVFVSLNGSVKISCGVNRLVCLNGLTKKFELWNNDDFDFLKSDSIFRQGMELSSWFSTKANQPIENVREISSAFGHIYPKGVLNKKWKEWSEKVELKTLTFFDVINDLTSMANRTLGGFRYKLLEAGLHVQNMETVGCCPTCSHKV